MPDDTQAPNGDNGSRPNRDLTGTDHPTDGWLSEAIRASTVAKLQNVARRARESGDLTPRDQQWCRALAEFLTSDVDAAAMRELVRQLPVTGGTDA